MKVQAFQLLFKPDGATFVPADAKLHELATAYAAEYVTSPQPLNFLGYKNSWVACEVDDEGKPVRVLGLLCMVLRFDFPVCRFTDNAATKKLVERANDYLHDQGFRGAEVHVHIASDELPKDRCPNYQEWMAAFGMKPADRYTYVIK
jgi:hypothetical protein